jgi:AcrR family transcriptional regulator
VTVPQVETELAGLLPPRPDLSPARARLFATALVLFGERGYHGVSVRDITDALGQKPGAIYAHVQSKQDLLFELVRIGHVEHTERLREAADAAGTDPVARITAIATAHVRAHLAYPALARVTNNEFKFLDRAQVEAVLAVRAETELLMLDAITRGVELGEFGTTDPYLAGMAIASMGIRAAEWWTPGSTIEADRLADTYAQFAINLLR